MRFDAGLSAWRLETADGTVRLPWRNPAMRPRNFEDRYDTETVFFDVFWESDYRSVTIVGAPMLGLARDLPFTLKALVTAVKEALSETDGGA